MPRENWTLEGVLDLIERIDSTMCDRSFAFILGAGASVSSGIPSGKALAQDWLEIIHKRECMNRVDLDTWLQQDPFNIGGKLNFANAAEFYPQIFERCFRGDHDSGYAALEAAMDGKAPGLGYSFLAEIIETTRHKVVVTTNFDNLVADALAMHAHQAPRIVGHEALAGFVRPYSRRPLIAKIHRDLLFSPINDPAGVDKLGEPWRNALQKIFQHYTPIVIGYGGNDGSLMGLLNSINKGEIAGQIIWCYRDTPPAQALEVLDKHDGILVKINDFDEAMLQLAGRLVDEFDAFKIADRMKKMGDERSETYRKQTTDLHAALARGSVEQKQAGELLSRPDRGGDDWWSRQMRANSEPDFKKRKVIYEEGIAQFPDSVGLHGNYANFLCDELGEFKEANAVYKRALELAPNDASIAGNYAVFLSDQLGDIEAAEQMYKRALSLSPKNARIVGNYANFLCDKRGEYDMAESMYKRALEYDPTDAMNTANYAVFLAIQRKELETAEMLYKRAIELDPKNSRTLFAYANLLAGKGESIDIVGPIYERVMALDPKNADAPANYASIALIRGEPQDLILARELSERSLALCNQPCQAQAEALLYLCLYSELIGHDPSDQLRRLKKILLAGYVRGEWDFECVFNAVLPRISSERRELFRAIGAAILDSKLLASLEPYEEWREL